MANRQIASVARALIEPEYTTAMETAQVAGIAIVAGEEMLRRVLQDHPYGVLVGSLALGALVGLLPRWSNGGSKAR